MVAWWESIVPSKELLKLTIYSFDPPHFQSDIAGLLYFNNLPHPVIIFRKWFCILKSTQTCRRTGTSAERKDRTRKPELLLKFYLQLSFPSSIWRECWISWFSKTHQQCGCWKSRTLLLLEIKFNLEEITDRYFSKVRPTVCSSAPHMGWQVLSCASPCWDRRELKPKKKKKGKGGFWGLFFYR